MWRDARRSSSARCSPNVIGSVANSATYHHCNATLAKPERGLPMIIFAKGIRDFVRVRRRYAYKLVVGIALLLLCASWLPGRFMVRTEILSGQAEHAVAYFLTGLTVTLVLV